MKVNPRFVGSAVLACAIASSFVLVAACGPTPDPNRVTNIYTPDDAFEQYAGGAVGTSQTSQIGVDGFLAARCATLDCHGQVGRPLRLFSQDGLRIVDDAGDYPGGAKETEDEIFANFTAAIGLQPELTSEVFAGNYDPHVLLILRKPLQLERHKGGQVLQANDPGDTCLTSWLSGNVDFTACATAAAVP
jgi:hypothetical protein